MGQFYPIVIALGFNALDLFTGIITAGQEQRHSIGKIA